MDGDDEKWTGVVWAMALWAWESGVESVGFPSGRGDPPSPTRRRTGLTLSRVRRVSRLSEQRLAGPDQARSGALGVACAPRSKSSRTEDDLRWLIRRRRTTQANAPK